MKTEERFGIQKRIKTTEQILTDSNNLYVLSTVGGFFLALSSKEESAWLKGRLAADELMRAATSDIKEIIKQLKSDPYLCVDFEEKHKATEFLINMRNGVVDLTTGRFIPRSLITKKDITKWAFTHYIDADYIEGSSFSDAPAFENFLSTSLEYPTNMKKATALLEIMGVCMSSLRKHRKAYFLIGAPRSGKSLTAEFIMKIIKPETSITGFSLHKLGERFNGPQLEKARINVDTEVTSAEIKDSSMFKILVAEEPFFMEDKGMKGYSARAHCKLLSCGNNLPKFSCTDASGNRALIDRFHMLFFGNSIEEANVNRELLEELIAEKDVIVSMAVDAVKKVVDRNYTFTTPDDSEEIIAEWIRENESVKTFIEERCVLSGKVHKSTLYAAYSRYCDDNCITKQKKGALWDFIVANFRTVKASRILIGDKYLYGFEGISLKEEVTEND